MYDEKGRRRRERERKRKRKREGENGRACNQRPAPVQYSTSLLEFEGTRERENERGTVATRVCRCGAFNSTFSAMLAFYTLPCPPYFFSHSLTRSNKTWTTDHDEPCTLAYWSLEGSIFASCSYL